MDTKIQKQVEEVSMEKITEQDHTFSPISGFQTEAREMES